MYYDPRDIRTVKVFFEDGTELGVLTAARPWGIPPHSLKVRQEILRLIEERKLEIREGDSTRRRPRYEYRGGDRCLSRSRQGKPARDMDHACR